MFQGVDIITFGTGPILSGQQYVAGANRQILAIGNREFGAFPLEYACSSYECNSPLAIIPPRG